MKTVFTVWIFINGINGGFVHGSAYDGWWPIQTKSEEVCNGMAEYATSNTKDPNLFFTCETLEDTYEFFAEPRR